MVEKEASRELDSIMNDSIDYVKLGKGKVGIGWLRNYTIRKITHIRSDARSSDKVELQMPYKIAACVVLNGYFKIMFFYSFLWRWYYYIKEYTPNDLIAVAEMGKKKVPLEGYYSVMMLFQDMNDTLKTMTREEVEHMLQELRSERKG